jgi:hypothetical protein
MSIEAAVGAEGLRPRVREYGASASSTAFSVISVSFNTAVDCAPASADATEATKAKATRMNRITRSALLDSDQAYRRRTAVVENNGDEPRRANRSCGCPS